MSRLIRQVGLSPAFGCNIGVRQGENLSPLLFAIYLNDLTEHLSQSYHGLTMIRDIVHRVFDNEDVMVYLRLCLLLYADDTILLAESPEELQAALHGIHHYCNTWRLEININKTKIMIFSRGKIRNKPNFMYDGAPLEVFSTFRYLGVDFSYNGRFHMCKKHLYNQPATEGHVLYSQEIQKVRFTTRLAVSIV